jgi:hypothetical protein
MFSMAALALICLAAEGYAGFRVYNESQFLGQSSGDRITLQSEMTFSGVKYAPGEYVVVSGGLHQVDWFYSHAAWTLSVPLVLAIAFCVGFLRMRAKGRAADQSLAASAS